MKTLVFLAFFLSGAAFADKLEYLSRDKNSGAAQVQHAGGKQSVQVGDEIPGWGRVHQVDDDAIQVVRKLSDAEKQARRDKGQLPVDAELKIVPRRDQRTVPVTTE